MVIMPVTVNNPNLQTTPISTFCVAFHIFIRGVARIFCLGADHVGHARPCEHRSCEAHAGGLGPPQKNFADWNA